MAAVAGTHTALTRSEVERVVEVFDPIGTGADLPVDLGELRALALHVRVAFRLFLRR